MLSRRLYQLLTDGREVNVFLRDQQRWLNNARILDLEGELVTMRYEIDDGERVTAWEEMVRLESIGSLAQRVSSVPRRETELAIAEDCPEAERFQPRRFEGGEDA